MALPKIYVDGILVNWADRLFFPPFKRQRTSGASPALLYIALGSSAKARHARAQIDRTTRKVPEVMVKVTNKKGAGRGMQAIREHLAYISRNGKLEIEDQNREVSNGNPEVRRVSDFWQVSGQHRIPDEPENGRGLDALNLMFSMVPGTPANCVKDAVREFLEEEFDGREYFFVLHTDTAHPHVHVCLKTEATRTQRRLRHGRRELQRWREGFAEKLRERGVEANATPRPTRGQPRLPIALQEHHKSKRQNRPPKQRPLIPPQAFDIQRNAWKTMAQALNHSSRHEDVRMARRIVDFWRTTPIGTASSVTHPPQENRKHANPDRLKHARIIAARLGYPALPKPDTGHPATRQPVKSISGLRHVSGRDLVQNGKSNELLLQPDARNYLEQQGTPNPKL